MSVGAVCTQSPYGYSMAMSTSETDKTESTKNRRSFSEVLSGEQKKCPYSSMAKDGVIEYNGVVFACDYESNFTV